MPIVKSQFKPAWWLRGAHAQTIWPALFRHRPKLEVTRERVELDDGDFLDLAWSGPAGGPCVMLLHGLEGSVHSHYAAGLMRALNRCGKRVCLMHFRGCGDQPNRLPISYHSGKTDDPARILDHITRTTGHAPYAAVGVSLGGNVLLKWLGEQGDTPLLQRAVAISVPFRLDDCAKRLEQGASRLYQFHLIRQLQRSYRRKFAVSPSPLNVDIDALRTFRQFDDQVTAALHGFDGVDDYYQRCSCRQYIPRIRVKTLIIQARNDPFMQRDTPPTATELPANVWLEMPEDGGHVGFVGSRKAGRSRYFLEERVAEWLAD
jgi:predicted alpha/beta-fold hydrolase